MIAMDQQALSMTQQQLSQSPQQQQQQQNQQQQHFQQQNKQNQNQQQQKYPRYSNSEDRRSECGSVQSNGPPASACTPAFSSAILVEDESNLTPVSVRDMVRRYNSASQQEQQKLLQQSQSLPMRRQLQFPLSVGRSAFNSMNKFNSQSLTPAKREVYEDDNVKTPPITRNSCRRCNSCKCCDSYARVTNVSTSERTGSRSALRCHSTGGESEYNAFASFSGESFPRQCIFCDSNEMKEQPSTLPSRLQQAPSSNSQSAVITPSILKERAIRRHSASDSMEDMNEQPMEASYQSKTTIAKTASGVRITIDIFFDQNQNVSPNDVIGSRVETDIPQSRILTEFQQQTKQQSEQVN